MIHSFFYEKQFAYLKITGTNIALIELIDEICKQIDSQQVVTGIFLDLSKAFNTISHDLLIKKLENCGIRGGQLNLMESYLANRKQFVNSEITDVNIGVPQGSVLGPLLFLIFVNDLSRLELFGEVYLYADDTSIIYSGTDTQMNAYHANLDLKLLEVYFSLNGLTVNVEKTYCVHFRSRQKRIEDSNRMLLYNERIKVKHETKFLGVIVDENLNWKSHTMQLKCVLSKIAGILFKVRYLIPIKAKLNIYHSLVYSRLIYSIETWGTTAKSNIKCIQRLQNKIVKSIFCKPALFPTTLLYQQVAKDLLPICAMHEYVTLVLMFKIKNNVTVSNLIMEENDSLYSRRTPHMLKLPA